MRSIVFLAAVALGLILAAIAIRPPAPRPVSAPPEVFSAARAMADVRAIAQRAHPTGSADAARVRGYVADRFRGLGLDVAMHSGEGVDDHIAPAPNLAVAGRVVNVVAVLHGRDPTAPALMVMCHDDSTPNSPGAADDTAGVASALEIARSLKATGPYARDVVFLVTDGEEAGLLGAQAFFADDPLRGHIGEILNMETRGDSGRAAMFETGPHNGALIAAYSKAAAHPDANSLATAIYRLMPNSTDLTRALQAGHTGMNFAFIGDELAYHTPLATPDHLNQGSLQHMGEQVLAAARVLASAGQPPPPRPDPVFFDLMGWLMVVYPPWLGWLVIGAAAVLTGAAIRDAQNRRGMRGALTSWSAMARGGGGLLLATLASALALRLAGRCFGAGEDRIYALIGRYDLLLAGSALLTLGLCLSLLGAMRIGLRRLAAVATGLILGAGCCLAGGFDLVGVVLGLLVAGLGGLVMGKVVDPWGGWLGALVTSLVLAAVVQLLLPAGAFMLAWPVLIASLCAFAILRTGERRVGAPGAVWIAGLGVVIVAAQGAVWAEALFEAIGPLSPAVMALSVPILFAALVPLADGVVSTSPGRLGGLLAVALGCGLLILAGGLGPSAKRPGLTQALYVADLTTPAEPHAYRIDALPRLDPWSRAVLTSDGDQPAHSRLSAFPTIALWNAKARPAPLSPPRLSLTSSPGGETVTAIPSDATAEGMDILIQPSFRFDTVQLDGRPIRLQGRPGRWAEVSFQAPPGSGVRLVVPTPQHGSLDVRLREIHDGWPQGLAPPPKPTDRMGYGLSDKTEVVTRVQAGW